MPYSKSIFMRHLLCKCQEVQSDKKPAMLRAWIEIQNDPELLLQESMIDKYNLSVQIDAFKKVFIDTLYELKSEQYYDMLEIRNDIRTGLPDADLSDVDRELQKRPHIRLIIRENPRLEPDYWLWNGHLSKFRKPEIITAPLHPFKNNNCIEPKLRNIESKSTKDIFEKTEGFKTSTRLLTLPYVTDDMASPKLTASNTAEVVLDAIPSLKRKLSESYPAKRSKSLQDVIMQLKEETIALLNSQEMDIISQKQGFKNIVSIVRSYSTTPFCQFIFINYLVDKFRDEINLNSFLQNWKTRHAGKLLLWAICEILNNTCLPYSTDSSVIDSYESLNTNLLQKTFISIHSQSQLTAFAEFVAIRQHLGRGVHRKLDLIDNHAVKIRPNLNWEHSVANYPANAREYFISPPISRKQNVDIGAIKSCVNVPGNNITHPVPVYNVSGTKPSPISMFLNSDKKKLQQQSSLLVTPKSAHCPVTTWEPQLSPELELDYEEETSDTDIDFFEDADIHKKSNNNKQISLSATTKTTYRPITTFELGFSPELNCKEDTNDLQPLEEVNIHREDYDAKKDQASVSSVPDLTGSDLSEFLLYCRDELARVKADSIHDKNMKARQDETELCKAKEIRDNQKQNEEPLCVQTIANTWKKKHALKVKSAPKVSNFFAYNKEGYNKKRNDPAVPVVTNQYLNDFRKSSHEKLESTQPVHMKADFIREKNIKAYQHNSELFKPDDNVKQIRDSVQNDEPICIPKVLDTQKKSDHTVVLLGTNQVEQFLNDFRTHCPKESVGTKLDSIRNKMEGTGNESRFTKQVDAGDEREKNDEEDVLFIPTVNSSANGTLGSMFLSQTNGVPCKVKVAPKVTGFDSISSKHKSLHSQSNHPNMSSTVTHSSSMSSKSTENSEFIGNKGGSWTASILPSNFRQSYLKNQESVKNNDYSSSKEPKVSKLEELRFKLSKDEAITTLPSKSSIREKERTMILLKEDFIADEYFNYLCSPLLKSFNLVKMYGKYRIKIVNHPVIDPGDS